MFSIANKGGGSASAFPDVCLVPPLPTPTPFANLASCRDAEDTSAKVLVGHKEVVVESSLIPMSQGDEPGVGGGVMSGVNLGPCRFKTASAKVYAAGKRVVIHTAITTHNGFSPNHPAGTLVEPSPGKVFAAG
jgi:hypothetical protein